MHPLDGGSHADAVEMSAVESSSTKSCFIVVIIVCHYYDEQQRYLRSEGVCKFSLDL